jgi:hypothetical protein
MNAMVRNKVYLAGCTFTSLTAAKGYAKAILDKHNSGDLVTYNETKFLQAAIALRGAEKLKKKIGAGIESIFIGYNDSGDKAFFIRRIDGSETDFSYIKCFTNPSILTDFSNACRNAIQNTKATLKTGLGYDQYHVHHNGIDFKTIVQKFIEDKHIDITSVVFLSGDGIEGSYFMDENLASDFREFHARLASLEVLPKEDHKTRHRRR